MRGPIDSLIEAQQPLAPAAGTAESSGAEPARPAGGKVLVRLLQLLESAGYAESATAVVDSAVGSTDREAFIASASEFTASPTSAPLIAEEPPSRGKRARAARGSRATGTEAGGAEDVARIYFDTGQQLAGPAVPGLPQWRSIGPSTIPNGQTYGSSRVNVSGRVSAIAVDPHDPAHVLAGAANGGVWESHDRGSTWAPRTDGAATLAVGAIAFDPTNAGTVYCGTGEGNWWSYLGAGILRSTDGGTTWSSLCTAPFIGQGFFDIAVDPANGQHLLGGTSDGLYVSTDGGVTWTRQRNVPTWTISMAPSGGATAEILAACGDGLFRSTNGGTSWSAVALPGSPGGFDRFAVSIAASNPKVAYAWGSSNGTPHLWRRNNAGKWGSVGAPPGVSTDQAWYDWYVAAAPDRDTQVYCGAIEAHRGDLTGSTWKWTTISNKGSSGDSVHPDQHAIAFEPGHPDTIYVGNDGGLFRSPDRGITWQHCNNGLVISEFEYLAQNPGTSNWLIGGLQDNGTARWTGSMSWDHVADGDGGDCAVSRANPSMVFHTYYGMSPERSSHSGDWASWANILPPIPSGEGSLFYPPLESSATNGDTIGIGGDALYLSRNNGGGWTRLAYPSKARSSAMYIPNADSVYVGTSDGRLYKTTWSGASWSALTALATPRSNAFMSDLYVDPRNMNRMWATYRTIGGARVFRSDDGGTTWSDRSAGLPGLPINAIEFDPDTDNRVWVAADLGVYQSLDGGSSWAAFVNGLPNAYVGDLAFHAQARVLRAGTRNRGVWEITVDGPMTQPVSGVQWTATLAAYASQRWYSNNWPASWHVVWTVMPTTPKTGTPQPQLSWTVQVERTSTEHATYWITVRNLTNAPVTFEGRYSILSRS